MKGKILYASVDKVKLVDDKTVAIGDKYSLLASQTTGTESATESTEAVKADATEATENGADDSVSDDDILNSVKQDNEVTFDLTVRRTIRRRCHISHMLYISRLRRELLFNYN